MMQIVTFFSPTQRAGRTTSLLALASGLLVDGKKISVIKLNEKPGAAEVRFADPLFDWEARILETCDEDMVSVSIVVDFETLIRALCFCEFSETDVVLVDTSSQQSKITSEILDRSTLVIVPFKDLKTAKLGAKWASQFRGEVAGLATGFENETDALHCQRKFLDGLALNARLPSNPLFQRQVHEGCIFGMDATSPSENKSPLKDALFRVEAFDACLAVEELSLEVMSKLQMTGPSLPAGS